MEHTQTIRQAVTLSQDYQKATMGRMSNLICLKHVKINNQRNIVFGDGRDEMNISPPQMVSVLDILSECEIEPFSGSIRNVVGERGNGGGPEAERKLWVLPRGERAREGTK